MICQITLCVEGVHSKTTIVAPSSIDALLKVLETLPQTVDVSAIVRVLKPA